MNTITEYVPELYATFWALIPPLVAIILALITKEVYSSLFIGIIIGGLLYGGLFTAHFSLETSILHVFDDGLLGVLSNPSNIGILIFLIILGIMVSMMNKAGGSKAFGEWASKRIKTRIGAELTSIFLGMLIFIDDYFNCLTVGSVMRPVTDGHNVSRAAAVTGFVENEDGFAIFMQCIPYNYYALLTIVALLCFVILKVDFGPMKTHEDNAAKGDLFTTADRPYANVSNEEVIRGNGKVIDLVFPIISLIICCVIGMIYTGGFFDGTPFSNCDASFGLMMGSFFAMMLTILFYVVRKILTFNDCFSCIPEGFKAMVPAILILTFAWTLKATTDSLGVKEYVAGLVGGLSVGFLNFLPAIIFIVAIFLAFATGTSWGTFGILIPIVVGTFAGTDKTMMIISISACMAGAVCGDHCSPISDTTIMASAGAQCNHMNHVSTQLPYVIVVAAVSLITYIIAGFLRNAIISLIIGIILMVGCILLIKYITDCKSKEAGGKQ